LLQTISHYEVLPESYTYGLADVRMISDFYASYWQTVSGWRVVLLPGGGGNQVHPAVSAAAVDYRLDDRAPSHLLAKSGSSLSAGFTLDRSHERTHEYRHVPCAADVRLPHGTRSRRHNNTRAGKRGWPYVPVILFQIFNLAKSLPRNTSYANELWGDSSRTYKLPATLTPTGGIVSYQY